MDLNKEQARAVDTIKSWLSAEHPGILSLQGYAGTGKTTLLDYLKPIFEERFGIQGVVWMAMTGKAALRLREVAKVPAKTLHSIMYEPPMDEQVYRAGQKNIPPKEPTLYVVDEASMVSPKIFADLKEWVEENGHSVLLVGDGYQLPPILDYEESKKNEDYSVFAHTVGPVLTEVMRSKDDVLFAATLIRQKQTMLRRNQGTGYGYCSMSVEELALWRADKLREGADAAIITWRNVNRMAINRAVRDALGYDQLQTPQAGELVLVCKNGQSMVNGHVVKVIETLGGPRLGPIVCNWMHVEGFTPRRSRMTGFQRPGLFTYLRGDKSPMDGGMPYMSKEDWSEFCRQRNGGEYPDPLPLTWGYCLSAHKAQGSEFDEVIVYLDKADGASKPFSAPSLLPDGSKVPFWCRFLYTALTRAKRRVTLAVGK